LAKFFALEPITEGNRGQALDGPDLSQEEHEVVSHAEQPLVAKETVRVERVKLGTQTITEQQQQVEETVRKEKIETDGADGSPPQQQQPPARRQAGTLTSAGPGGTSAASRSLEWDEIALLVHPVGAGSGCVAA